MTSMGLLGHPAKLIESYKKGHLGVSRNEHIFCFLSSCQLGFRLKMTAMTLVI
jgi:hypothetical protein